MLERDFENILVRYPDLLEEGVQYVDRQIYVEGKYVDLLFEDKFGTKIIIELKRGTIRREHMAQLLDYEGHYLSVDDPTIRVMLVGNRVPPNIPKSTRSSRF